MTTKKANLLLAALFLALVAGLMWVSAPRDKPTTTATFTASDEKGHTPITLDGIPKGARMEQAISAPMTVTPALEGAAAVEASIDTMPIERLYDGMVAFLANYPEEATEYALRKIKATPDTRDTATAMYIAATSYTLAQNRPALARYLDEVPANVRLVAEYSATARYVDDGDIASAVASITPTSESFTLMSVADLYAKRDPLAAAEWAQQFQGTHNYEIAIMSVIRAYAKTDATKARQWLKAMPAGSNQQLLLAELNSAPR